MDTLHDRLAELADEAPRGGAPAAELWARGRRGHRLRAAALAATLLVVVGTVGTGVGVRLSGDGDGDGDGDRSSLASAGKVGIALPIEYPTGKELPDLGDTPGPLAAIWLPYGGQAVGLVAETGTFGTLSIEDYVLPLLSPDGRRIAYLSPSRELVVRDLVSGESYSPPSGFETRVGFRWIDATHLHGLVAGGSLGDGWVWEPGTAPKSVNPQLVPYGGTDLSIPDDASGNPRFCESPPTLQNVQTFRRHEGQGPEREGSFQVPVLCDILGVIGPGTLLGHWNSDRLPGDWDDPDDGNRTVVALDIHGADFPFEDPGLRRVVATAGGPERVWFASDLIGQALDADGGAS